MTPPCDSRINGNYGKLPGLPSRPHANRGAGSNAARSIAAHPLTPKQTIANQHFLKCAEYQRLPISAVSASQKNMLLGMEGCHSDERDDPRIGDATDPWNPDFPTPWKVAQ
jgi:hypothetical protein